MSSGTWLYYFNARWYDATLGRFVTEDPARDGLNWYIYTYNNPLRWIDPTGFWPILDPFTGYIKGAINECKQTVSTLFSRENAANTTVEIASASAEMVADHVEAVVEHPVAGPILGFSAGVGEVAQASNLATTGAGNIAIGNTVVGSLQIAGATYLAADGIVRASNVASADSIPDIVGDAVDQPEAGEKVDAAVQAGLAVVDLVTGPDPTSAVLDVVTLVDTTSTLASKPNEPPLST